MSNIFRTWQKKPVKDTPKQEFFLAVPGVLLTITTIIIVGAISVLKDPNQGIIPSSEVVVDSASSTRAIEIIKGLNLQENQLLSTEQIHYIAGKVFDVNNPPANGKVNGSQAEHDLLRYNYIKNFIESVNYASNSLNIHKKEDLIRYATMQNGKDVQKRLKAEAAQKPGDASLQTKITNTSNQVNSWKEYFDAHAKAAPSI